MLAPSIRKQGAAYILRRNGLTKDKNKYINKAVVKLGITIYLWSLKKVRSYVKMVRDPRRVKKAESLQEISGALRASI